MEVWILNGNQILRGGAYEQGLECEEETWSLQSTNTANELYSDVGDILFPAVQNI